MHHLKHRLLHRPVTRDRYTSTAIALHWLIALLLLGQFVFGLTLEDIPRGTPERGIYVNLHKSTGILIALLISKPNRTATLALLLSLAAPPALLHAEPFAYVPNEGSGTVSVIDTATDRVVAELPGGSKPRGMAVGIDRHWLYVSDQPNNRL